MIENLKNINDRNTKLEKMSTRDIDQMYLRVFSTPDGEMVMQDIANRSFVQDTTMSVDIEQQDAVYNEGMRAMWLSIQSRIQQAVQPEIKEK